MSSTVESPIATRPFHIDILDGTLEDLRRRIAATNWPEKETVVDQSQGVPGLVIQKRAWAELMERLGYQRYVAQGADWGAFVVDQMGLQARAGLGAIHISMPATVPADVNDAAQEYKGGFFNAKGVSIPVAATVFPGERYHAPRSWAEQAYPNLIYFNEVDKGGHFAAWEEPQLFAEELRAAFRPVR